MRVLVVAPYPPLRDGIASYTVQFVAALRRQGHDVEVLSPEPSAAHHHLDLAGARGGLALARRVRHYDRVVLQYHPAFHYRDQRFRHRSGVDLALAVAFRLARDVEVWLHEVEYGEFESSASRRRVASSMWRAANRVYFHSDVERDRFLETFRVDPGKALLGRHGASFLKRTGATREQARRSLGIGDGELTFLAIGFVQPHKGFDRAVEAFRGLAAHGARLDVVGSIRWQDARLAAYCEELEALCNSVEGASLHEGYVSDELFDRWIVAADVVVLPYREIWSSGVMERAALYGRPVIATKVGGLVHQASNREVTLVDDDEELREAMWKAAGAGEADLPRSWPAAGPDLWERVQQEVLDRAASRRGPMAPARRKAGGQVTRLRLEASAPLRRVPRYERPEPVSARPGASLVKRLVQRVTSWQLEPIEAELQMLHDASIRSVERVADAVETEPPKPKERRPGG